MYGRCTIVDSIDIQLCNDRCSVDVQLYSYRITIVFLLYFYRIPIVFLLYSEFLISNFIYRKPLRIAFAQAYPQYLTGLLSLILNLPTIHHFIMFNPSFHKHISFNNKIILQIKIHSFFLSMKINSAFQRFYIF